MWLYILLGYALLVGIILRQINHIKKLESELLGTEEDAEAQLRKNLKLKVKP